MANETVAVFAPSLVGVKRTVKVVALPFATVVGFVSWKLNWLAPVPAIEKPLNEEADVPVL